MPAGPGVRVDTAVDAGFVVPAEYDNLIAKVLVHAADRPSAIDRLRRSLDEVEIAGIQTTLPFHRFVARDAGFRAGEVSTSWVDEHWQGAEAFDRAARLARIAAGLAALEPAWEELAGVDSSRRPSTALPGTPASVWARSARELEVDRWPE
jgi:acetyl/propionyl-CoA carboxylase alpha subunit